MLSPLDLKLLRDIGKMKGQMVSVSVVMACGLAMMIMARSLILSLESTRDAYYTDHRFADVFCDVKRAPNALRARLERIEGAATVDGARQRLKIVGIALSPEYVFEARPGETLPDNKRFGVFWMNERDLAK